MVGVVSQEMIEISLNVSIVVVSDIQGTPVGTYMVIPRSFKVVLLSLVHFLGSVAVLGSLMMVAAQVPIP